MSARKRLKKARLWVKMDEKAEVIKAYFIIKNSVFNDSLQKLMSPPMPLK